MSEPSLVERIAAAGIEAERMQNAEAEAVGGDIAASRLWFELEGLRRHLRRAESRAALIERLMCRTSS